MFDGRFMHSVVFNEILNFYFFRRLIISCLRNCASVLSIIGISNQDIRSEIWCTIQNLLDQIVSLWKLQEDKRQKQKQDEDNPYVYR